MCLVLWHELFNSVKDSLGEGTKLLIHVTRQRTHFLVADLMDASKHHNSVVLSLVHLSQASSKREQGLTRTGSTAQGNDSHVPVHQVLDSESLLCILA